MRCASLYNFDNGKRKVVFQCGAEDGHEHAHVTMDEASGGLVFWECNEGCGYWWYAADHTEQQLTDSLKWSKGHGCPIPNGITWELFKQARG